jgi:putative SOS response-associated peptidase YedK
MRKAGEITNGIYAFPTINPNAEVGTIHPKAMPVILQSRGEWDTWMSAPWTKAMMPQRPLPDGSLRIVGHGGKTDEWIAAAPT